MKLLIVFSALCLVTVASEQKAAIINENTIPKFLANCPENIYAASYGEDGTMYSTVCSLKDYIGYIPECSTSNKRTEIHACAYPVNSETEVVMYAIKIKENKYFVRQTTADVRKVEPDTIIEKSCQELTQWPKYCTLKNA